MRRAFVIGNVAIDEVFRMDRLPQSGESVLGGMRHVGLGGKGANQAIAMARAGVDTMLVAAVGIDAHADLLRRRLATEPVYTALIERSTLSTDRSIVLADDAGENIIVTTNDCAASLTISDCKAALLSARPGDLVLLQGNLRNDVTAGIAVICEDARLTLVLNPSPFDPAVKTLLPLVSVLFVNETEARGLTGGSPEEAVAILRSAGVDQVVLTKGADGALLGMGTDIHHIPAVETQVIDATGAGDSFEGAAIASAVLRGTGLDAVALRHGAKAAAMTISSVGAVDAFPTAEDLRLLLSESLRL